MKIKELLSNRSKWCKGSGARTAKGNPVQMDSKHAKSWCLYGALFKCYGGIESKFNYAHSRLVQEIGLSITKWNDCPFRTFQEVKQLLKKLDI